MSNDLPAAALGHFVMKVNDIDASYQFYTKLGLRPFGIFPDLAVIELRGGTHILLFSEQDELPFLLSSSHLGQRGAFFNEPVGKMNIVRCDCSRPIFWSLLFPAGRS
jgi:catechol 2,3-dioxygenase-like lactoylglutathione lyase family enzyme